MLHLEHVLSSSLNVLCDLVAMRGPEEQRPQDEHIERALQEFGPVWKLPRCHDGRDSTLSNGRRTTLGEVSQKDSSVSARTCLGCRASTDTSSAKERCPLRRSAFRAKQRRGA